MVIKVVNYVSQCYSNSDGAIIYSIIDRYIEEKEIVLSFDGIDIVSSSFVNAALIPFINLIGFAEIKRKFKIINTTKQINDMIKRRFQFEANRITNEADIINESNNLIRLLP
ncbi:MAG: STAS-like domain-containing protein [Proteobacteria bacterium]|nr:STAS-like domain-containing protein [Pseudomonadota bacterium]